jgi:hypothetical protein
MREKLSSLTRAEYTLVLSGMTLFSIVAAPILWEIGKELWDIGTALLSVSLSILLALIYLGVLVMTAAVIAILTVLVGVVFGIPRAKAIRARLIAGPGSTSGSGNNATVD